MPITKKQVIKYTGVTLAFLASVLAALWITVTHKPKFYEELIQPKVGENRVAEAKKFVAQSLQLRNDIANEPTWDAVFSDREVNAWIAEELVTHFADQLPPEIHDPRIVFESDHLKLAFTLDQGAVHSVVWVVAKATIPEPNVISLTLEKINAGALPIPPGQIVATITAQAKRNGLDISWSKDGSLPVATIRYKAGKSRTDVVLERLSIREGQIKLSGKSNKTATAAAPKLPTRQGLQENFPKRKSQVDPAAAPVPDVDAPPVDLPAPPPKLEVPTAIVPAK
jgi:hypothetical protein